MIGVSLSKWEIKLIIEALSETGDNAMWARKVRLYTMRDRLALILEDSK